MDTKTSTRNVQPEHCDFDHPSFWFVMEDRLKSLLGCAFYSSDIKSLCLKGDESVLDFGCGGGIAARCLLKSLSKTGSVLGVDTSAYWINIAKKRAKKFPNAEFVAGDIIDVDIPEHSKDAVIIIHVLHHIPAPERAATLDVLSRILKKEGRLLIRERIDPSHGIPAEAIRSLLAKAGFKEVTFDLGKSEYRGLFVRV